MVRYRIDGFGDEHYLFVFDDEDGSVRISGYIDAVNFPIIENKSCIVTKVRLLGFKLIIDTFMSMLYVVGVEVMVHYLC